MKSSQYYYFTRKSHTIIWSLMVAFFAGIVLAGIPLSHATATPLSSGEPPKNIIYAVVKSQDTQEWQTIPGYWVNSERPSIKAFFTNPENQTNMVGYFNMRFARVAEIKELPVKAARQVIDYDSYATQYGTVRVFYVGIDYRVQQEDRNHYNGINYRLVVLVPQQGEWRIAEMSEAPVDTLVNLGYGFKSKDEQGALKIKQARYQGLYINLAGRVINKNAADVAALRKQRGNQPLDAGVEVTATSNPTPPSIIYVWLTKSVNLSFYHGSCAASVQVVVAWVDIGNSPGTYPSIGDRDA